MSQRCYGCGVEKQFPGPDLVRRSGVFVCGFCLGSGLDYMSAAGRFELTSRRSVLNANRIRDAERAVRSRADRNSPSVAESLSGMTDEAVVRAVRHSVGRSMRQSALEAAVETDRAEVFDGARQAASPKIKEQSKIKPAKGLCPPPVTAKPESEPPEQFRGDIDFVDEEDIFF